MSHSFSKKFPLMLARVFVLAWAISGSIGCGQQPTTTTATVSGEQPQNLPTVQITVADKSFVLQLAATEQQRAIGLMHRDSMPADQGMIFTFTDEQPQSFWMKNTHIPLDIIYLDHDGRVVSIHQGKPFDLSGLDSAKPAKYVVELNVGVAAKIGLKPGDVVKVPQEVTSAAR